MQNDAQVPKYAQKVQELSRELAKETGVGQDDVVKLLRHLGIEGSLRQRDIESELVGKYKLNSLGTVNSEQLTVERLRIASGPNPQ